MTFLASLRKAPFRILLLLGILYLADRIYQEREESHYYRSMENRIQASMEKDLVQDARRASLRMVGDLGTFEVNPHSFSSKTWLLHVPAGRSLTFRLRSSHPSEDNLTWKQTAPFAQGKVGFLQISSTAAPKRSPSGNPGFKYQLLLKGTHFSDATFESKDSRVGDELQFRSEVIDRVRNSTVVTKQTSRPKGLLTRQGVFNFRNPNETLMLAPDQAVVLLSWTERDDSSGTVVEHLYSLEVVLDGS